MINLTKNSKRPSRRFKVHLVKAGLPACGAGLRRGVYGDAYGYSFQETIEEVNCQRCLEIQAREQPPVSTDPL